MRTSYKYLIAFVVGLLITPFAARAAFMERQYFAIGGELLIPFLMVALLALWEEFKAMAAEMFGQAVDAENKGHKKSTQECAQTKIISLD